MNVLELFGGIGACTESLKQLNINFNIVDYVEIDKFAVKSYNAMNVTNYKPQDISDWDKDIKVDFIMHGSPCQSISISGKQTGCDIGSNTRSSLMWETVRIIKSISYSFLSMQNSSAI